MSALPLPDALYNWIVNYLSGRFHCTKSNNVLSSALPINASVVQGSALGPVAFIINATDLNVVTPDNKLHKYADDTYLIVPSANSQSISAELAHISGWAEENNLKRNTSKSLEMVVCRSLRGKSLVPITFPTEIPNVATVTSLNILGVIIQQNLTIHEHVNPQSQSLSDICRATLVAKLTYASPAWQGYTTSTERARLQAVLSKARRWGVYSPSAPDFEAIINSADKTLFTKMLCNKEHVLQSQLPP